MCLGYGGSRHGQSECWAADALVRSPALATALTTSCPVNVFVLLENGVLCFIQDLPEQSNASLREGLVLNCPQGKGLGAACSLWDL